MLPRPCSAMTCPAARSTWKVPLRFTVTTRSNSSSAYCTRGLRTLMPGVTTATSTEPKRLRTSATRVPVAAESVTSTGNASATPPASRMAPAVSEAASPRRSAHTTAAPWAARACAAAAPIPEPAPTTRATRPSRRNMRA
jgi:hypothetical protein